MRRRILSITFLVLLCFVAYEGAARWTIHSAAHAAVIAKPFTLERWTYGSDERLIEQRTFARRSDGSEATVSVFPQTKDVLRRIDFADGSAMSLIDALQAKMSGWRDPRQVAAKKRQLSNPPQDCTHLHETLLRRETVLGVETNVTRQTARPDGGGWRVTEWRAPDYACKAVAMQTEDPQPDGTYRARDHTDLLYLLPGEPDPRLFEHGGAYKEMRPSEIRDAALRQQGFTPDKCPQCFASNFAAADAAYQAAQKQPR